MRNKILLVTGSEAASSVKKISKGRVHVCPVDVAALLSVDSIGDELSKLDLSRFRMVLVPGLVSGDTSRLSKRLNVPVYKGTKHHSDIPLLLDNLSEIKLSTSLPADLLIEKKIRGKVAGQLKRAYKLKKDFVMKIGRKKPVYLGKHFPMQVIAEIPDAPLLSKQELKSKARYYVNSGANVIDVGMVSGVDNSPKIKAIVAALRSAVSVPLSIDSMDEEEILMAVKSGVDLVLSVGESNQSIAGEIDVPFVVVPVDKNGKVPARAEDRVEKLGRLARKFNGKEIILDPILSPLNYGFIESIKALSMLRKKYPKIPLFMGAGNVTELVDVDSHGVNSLLAGVASEIGVELLFTVEASPKTRGCVSELATAAKMMYLARLQDKSPKDLGLDLLKLKDKRRSELLEKLTPVGIRYIQAKNVQSEMEERYYKIQLKDNKISVLQYNKKNLEKGYLGSSAEALYKKICSTEEISRQHAAYLGKELAKAEIALKLGKDYAQDEKLF